MAETYAGADVGSHAYDIPDEDVHAPPGMARTIARRYLEEGVGTTAAGIGLIALTALPAALLAIAAIYGLVASRGEVETHVTWLSQYAPEQVGAFVSGLLDHVTAATPRTLTLTAVGSIAFAILAAQRAMAATTGALDRIGRLEQRPTLVRRQVAALVLALVGIALLCVAVYAMVQVEQRFWWPGMLTAAVVFLTIVIRGAPRREDMTWKSAIAGALVGTILAVIASLGLSWWVSRVSSYEAMFGAAGSVVVVLLWAYLVALAVLLGGLIAAELHHRHRVVEDAWNS